jgi:hypothetical protein
LNGHYWYHIDFPFTNKANGGKKGKKGVEKEMDG